MRRVLLLAGAAVALTGLVLLAAALLPIGPWAAAHSSIASSDAAGRGVRLAGLGAALMIVSRAILP